MKPFRVYVDSSVVLRRLLQEPDAIPDWSSWSHAVSSELLQVEVLRTLDRLRVERRLDDSQYEYCLEQLEIWLGSFELVPLNRPLLRRAAAPMPTPLGTLAAIHLATALIWMERKVHDLTLLTHDRQLAVAARACGIEVFTKP